MKKILLGLALLTGSIASAQNGLESIIVEKYYVSNSVDANGSVGTLPAGSVTYRFFVDMLPGYKFQAAYGAPAGNHVLTFSTTTSFFNNEDRGAVTPTWTKTQARSNSVMLDSYLSAGAACSGNFGVLKSEDDGVATVVNNSVPPMLQNNDPSAGIPLTVQDGLLLGAPSAVTTIGQTDAQAGNVFDATSQAGSTFTLTDGAWSSLVGAQGPTASNRVLIAQITTDGILTYALNIQIGTPTGGVERYVHTNPTGSEIDIPSLSGTLGAPNVLPTVNITSPLNGAGFIIGSNISVTADAADANGSVSQVEFFVNGVSIGVDNSSPYSASFTGNTAGSQVITAVATDNEGGQTTSSAITINVATNPPPTVNITSPANGAGFITGDVVAITATATDNGSVAQVEFFVDGISIGVDNTAPYAANYNAVLGPHVITATATDNAGLTASASVNIAVLNNVPPTSTITAPAVGSLFTAPAVVTINANATDADGTVTQVEFFVNGVSIGVDTDAPYTIDWTSTIGVASIVARSTDNRGATTNSAPRVLNIADPNGLPYNLGGQTISDCNDTSFCLPIIAFTTVSDVIGYDIVLNYDNTKFTPTGNITIAGDLVTPSQAEAINSINAAAGSMNISVFFNGSAPATARFAGTGELICVEFVKTGTFAPVDTADFSVSFMQESYFTGVQTKLVDDGSYISFRDSLYEGKLTVWTDNSPLGYDVANPNASVITNIFGTDASCGNESATSVQPDPNGVFSYNTSNGLNIAIKKDISGSTDVQAVINGADALLARRVLLNDNTFTPSAYQIIAMDVNIDGNVSAGDVSQINQRAVLFIPEFKQAFNYDINGVSNGTPSKDWLFIDSTILVSSPAYTISATYPANDGVGYSKFNVPSVDFCLPVKVVNFNACPEYTFTNYQGILVGDVNGNVATATPSSLFKSETEKVIVRIDRAQISQNEVTVPVYFTSAHTVNAFDFSMKFNESSLNFGNIESNVETAESFSHLNGSDRTVRFTSNSLTEMNSNRPVAFFTFQMLNGNLHASDLNNLAAYLNGEAAEVEVIGELALGNGIVDYNNVVSVFPNPASTFAQVMSMENATLTIMDAAGRVVGASVDVIAGQVQTIATSDLAAGVYHVRIANNNFNVTKKLVVKK